MKTGDLVRIYIEPHNYDETYTGIVLQCYINESAKLKKCDTERWIFVKMLIDGKIQLHHLYWDDDYEILQ